DRRARLPRTSSYNPCRQNSAVARQIVNARASMASKLAGSIDVGLARMTVNVASALRDAMEGGRVVRVYRQSLESDHYSAEGFVVGVEEDLVLVHVIDPAIVLDGFRVLRVADVTTVDSSFESAPFLERALRLRRQRPRKPDGIRLDSVRALIESAGQSFPLITLHRAREHKDSCRIE